MRPAASFAAERRRKQGDTMKCAYSTNIGAKRKSNQDAYLAANVEKDGILYYVFAVADGLGGHRSGEVASQIAIDSIKEHIGEIQDFTNYGNTTEDYLSAEAIRAALKGLNRTDLGDLKDVAPDLLLKEMLIEYIKFSFAFRYEEKIRMKRNPEETERLLEKMDKYISNELHNNLKLEDIKTMDFGHLQASEVVKRSLEDAYQVFELFYGEA